MRQRNSSNGQRQSYTRQPLSNNFLMNQGKEKFIAGTTSVKSQSGVIIDDFLKSKEPFKTQDNSKQNGSLKKKANSERTGSLQKPPRHPSAKTGVPRPIMPIDHEKQKAKLNNLMNSLTKEGEENKDANSQQQNQGILKYSQMSLTKKGSLKQLHIQDQKRKGSADRKKHGILAVSGNSNQTPKAQTSYGQRFGNQNSQNNSINTSEIQKKQIQKNEKPFNIRNNRVIIRNNNVQQNQRSQHFQKVQQRSEQELKSNEDLKSRSLGNQDLGMVTDQDAVELTEQRESIQQLSSQNFHPALSPNKSKVEEEFQSPSSNFEVESHSQQKRKDLVNQSYSSNSSVLSIQDKYQLFAWGLQLREQIRKRKYFIEVVEELKSRFRRVLYMYQDKKAERNFLEIKALIENFDQSDVQKAKKQLGGKISRKNRPNKFMGINPVLQTVVENEEEQNETTFRNNESDEQESREAINEDIQKEINVESENISKFKEKQYPKSEEQSIVNIELELIKEQIFERMVEKELKDYSEQAMKNFIKVKSFLQMVIKRNRFLKMREKIVVQMRTIPQEIQNIQEYNSTEEKSLEKVEDSKSQLKIEQQNPEKLAVQKIEKCYKDYKMRKMGKQIREYLKGLPFEVRRSYVKYYDLKSKTSQLKNEVTSYQKKLCV